MSTRLPVVPAPEPLEAYAQHFDPLFTKRNQRDRFRRYLEGLLLPAERNKTLTALANTEPVVGAQHRQAQSLQWFLSESTWDSHTLNRRRVDLLRADPTSAPDDRGVLVIDETGDRKDGHKTAHVGRQYLANLGKTDNGVVSVSSLWADERVYYPLEVEPYTPAHWFARGKADPAFRTKPQLALTLVERAVTQQWPFRAVVADAFYGENPTFRMGLSPLTVGYVLGLKPSHCWWHATEDVGSLAEVAEAADWAGPKRPGAWGQVVRTFRDGHAEVWWALEVVAGPYGPTKHQRAIVVTTDPGQLPDVTTWYLLTNLPAPGSERAATSWLTPASLAEIVRLYGLRMWVEQSYKQVKHALGWAEYQVRSDVAMRRHWVLVWCAFSFCWWQLGHGAAEALARLDDVVASPDVDVRPTELPGREKKAGGSGPAAPASVLAGRLADGTGVAGAVDHAQAVLARVVARAPTTGAPGAARLGAARLPAVSL
jgi:DDE superfamily endonuclease